MRPYSREKSDVGKLLFESKELSLNGDIACRNCHLDEFSSADGIPNAVGVGGSGKGLERLRSGGAIVPRNALPLWGRGAKSFPSFFWDGKVEVTDAGVISQFGSEAPSSDALTVAVHLPFVEIREMLVDDAHVSREFEKEEVSAAERIFALLVHRVRKDDALNAGITKAFGIRSDEISFGHIAESINHFIRDRFMVRATKFHQFVFGGEPLTSLERAGGLVFYGKGRCSSCHTGPHFSDFKFHSIPFPQAGFGKNGFGIDYGRYNVTFDDRDLYKFRTPPLFNVAKTAPYSHSGAVAKLGDAVRYHFDPLRFFDPGEFDLTARVEWYKRISVWTGDGIQVPILSDDDVKAVVAFLETLSFESNETQ
ncbi:MAG: His-Xaa-Ser system-associated MauG-like protein [Phycisphaerales bacterium]|nr:His-Xaa-Ser system-associated MauG-like protein [Phycisphaerales bacterium]